jgi:16S rRNA (guanine527-N7)-methyltransferase
VVRMPWASLRARLPGDEAIREAALERLRSFALELLRWNRGVSNLVSHDDEARLVDRHIAESLATEEVQNMLTDKKIVDFGSGGGFPALPLVLAGCGREWTLVESRRNKTLFLRRAVQELGLHNVRVVTGRLEALVEQAPDELSCDAFTSRATMKLGPTLGIAAHIVGPGGVALLWKGSGFSEEAKDAAYDWRRDWEERGVVPLPGGPNVVAVFIRKKMS